MALIDRAVDGERVASHPGSEPAIGDVDVVVTAWMDRDGELDRRHVDDFDPSACVWRADRLVDGHRAAAVWRQRRRVAVPVHPTWPGDL